MNVRTYYKLMSIAPWLFTGIFLSMVLDLHRLGYILTLVLAVLGLYGATLAFLMVFGRFRLGCPFCRASAKVTSISGAPGGVEMVLHCPQCGYVLTRSRYFSLHCEKLDDTAG